MLLKGAMMGRPEKIPPHHSETLFSPTPITFYSLGNKTCWTAHSEGDADWWGRVQHHHYPASFFFDHIFTTVAWGVSTGTLLSTSALPEGGHSSGLIAVIKSIITRKKNRRQGKKNSTHTKWGLFNKVQDIVLAISLSIFMSWSKEENLLGGAGDWTRGLSHAKRALYQWATPPPLLSCVSELMYLINRLWFDSKLWVPWWMDSRMSNSPNPKTSRETKTVLCKYAFQCEGITTNGCGSTPGYVWTGHHLDQL